MKVKDYNWRAIKVENFRYLIHEDKTLYPAKVWESVLNAEVTEAFKDADADTYVVSII